MPHTLAFCNGTQRPRESTTHYEERLLSTTKKSKYPLIKDPLSEGMCDRLYIDVRETRT